MPQFTLKLVLLDKNYNFQNISGQSLSLNLKNETGVSAKVFQRKERMMPKGHPEFRLIDKGE